MARQIRAKPGDRYGRLTILKIFHQPENPIKRSLVDVRCDCGGLKTVWLDNLYRGYTKSCGCLRRENSLDPTKMPRKKAELPDPGTRFNRYTIIEAYFDPEMGRTMAKAVCDCGTEKIIRLSNLANETIRSCGCLRRNRQKNRLQDHWEGKSIDRIGQVSGELTVVRRDYSREGGSYIWWVCQCSCGREIALSSSKLSGVSRKPTLACPSCLKNSQSHMKMKLGEFFNKKVLD